MSLLCSKPSNSFSFCRKSLDLTRPYVILPQLLHVEEISLWKEFLGQESVRTSGLNKLNRHCRTSQKLQFAIYYYEASKEML